MKLSNQRDLIHQLSSQQLKQQLYLSQLVIFIISVILSFFLFDSINVWLTLFEWSPEELLIYGVLPGVLVVSADLFLMKFLPAAWYDDGGINEKIFADRSVAEVFIISLLVAGAEELLFRGVLQTAFGYIVASLLFALVHFRYLTKPVLLVSVLMVSFYLGWIYELTDNLLTTILAHFIIDFSLALVIKFKHSGGKNSDRERHLDR